MTIVMITGIQAAGKSTIAQALADQFEKSAHVRGDQFRRFVVNGRAEMSPDPDDNALAQLHLRYELSARVADAYAEASFTTVLQDIYLGDELPGMIARIRHRPLYVVVICPSTEAVAQRDANRQAAVGKVAYRPDTFSIGALDTTLRKNTPRLGWWLDTSRLTVEESVATILEHLDEARIDD